MALVGTTADYKTSIGGGVKSIQYAKVNKNREKTKMTPAEEDKNLSLKRLPEMEGNNTMIAGSEAWKELKERNFSLDELLSLAENKQITVSLLLFS